MDGGEADPLLGAAVGSQLVSHQNARRETLLLHEIAHQLHGRGRVPPPLHQQIQHLALAVDGAPQVHPPAADHHDHLVQVPPLRRSWPPSSKVAREEWTEFQDPAPDRLVGDIETALRQQVFNVPIAQRKAQIEPDGVPYGTVKLVPVGSTTRGNKPKTLVALSRVCVAALRRGATMDRILLVDDDPEVRSQLKHFLLDNGFQVTIAESVASASTFLDSQPFDLAICEVNLPDGSGLAVADQAEAAGVKALVVTRKDLTPQPGKLAPYDYLLNPLRFVALLDGIEWCLIDKSGEAEVIQFQNRVARPQKRMASLSHRDADSVAIVVPLRGAHV